MEQAIFVPQSFDQLLFLDRCWPYSALFFICGILSLDIVSNSPPEIWNPKCSQQGLQYESFQHLSYLSYDRQQSTSLFSLSEADRQRSEPPNSWHQLSLRVAKKVDGEPSAKVHICLGDPDPTRVPSDWVKPAAVTDRYTRWGTLGISWLIRPFNYISTKQSVLRWTG